MVPALGVNVMPGDTFDVPDDKLAASLLLQTDTFALAGKNDPAPVTPDFATELVDAPLPTETEVAE